MVSKRSRVWWWWFGQKLPQSEVVFFTQVLIIYTVIILSLVNLTLNHPEKQLWTALLGSCLGYLLPQPTFTPKSTPLKHVPDSARVAERLLCGSSQ